jgi:hypothetical protein
MAKMLRNIKSFGRCTIKGHSICNCELTQEIQSKPITKSKERSEFRKDLKLFFKEMDV